MKYEFTNGTKTTFDKKIAVIEGDSFTLLCDAEGNPPPTLQWDGMTGNASLKFTSIMYDTSATCTADFKMEETVGERKTGSTSAKVTIEVLCMYYLISRHRKNNWRKN